MVFNQDYCLIGNWCLIDWCLIGMGIWSVWLVPDWYMNGIWVWTRHGFDQGWCLIGNQWLIGIGIWYKSLSIQEWCPIGIWWESVWLGLDLFGVGVWPRLVLCLNGINIWSAGLWWQCFILCFSFFHKYLSRWEIHKLLKTTASWQPTACNTK